MGASFWIFARGSWRRLDETSGRVSGWTDPPRFCYYRRRDRLELASCSTVLRGLRALKAKQPTTVRNGLPLKQRRKKPPKPSRCCCSHKCQNANLRSALVQVNLSTQSAISTQTISALQPIKTDAAVQANVENANVQTDKTSIEVLDTRAWGDGGSESSAPACKELIVNEEDVSALRSFLEHHNMFNVDLLRFDTDDDYKSIVFYKINPLVSIEKCPRINALLAQSRQCSLREFTRVLGLREVNAPAHRGKENLPVRRRARVFTNKSANKSANESSNTSDSDTTNQSDSDFESKTYFARNKKSVKKYNSNSTRKSNDNNKVSTSKLKSNKGSDTLFESDEEDIQNYMDNTTDISKEIEPDSKENDADKRKIDRVRTKHGTFAKSIRSDRVRTKYGTFAKSIDNIDSQDLIKTNDIEESDESISIIPRRITRGHTSDVLPKDKPKEDDQNSKERQRGDDGSKETDRRNKRKFRDSSDSDDEGIKEIGTNLKFRARTVASVAENMLRDTVRRQSLRSQNTSPTKSLRSQNTSPTKSLDSQPGALQRSDRHKHTDKHNDPNIRHSIEAGSSNVLSKDRNRNETSQSIDRYLNDLRKRTNDKKIHEKSPESIERRSKGKHIERERDGSEVRERSNRLRSDSTLLKTDSRKSRIDNTVDRNSDISKSNDINGKYTKRRSVRLRHNSTSSESDSQLRKIDKTADRNSGISKNNDINVKNTKRRSGRLRHDNTLSDTDSRKIRIDNRVDRNSDISKSNDIKNTKRRSGRLGHDNTTSETDSRKIRIDNTVDRNSDISKSNDIKNTKRRSGRLRHDSTSSESDSRLSRIDKNVDRNSDISKKNDINYKNIKRSGRLRHDSTTSKSDSRLTRIKSTVDRNGDISKSNSVNDKNTKRRSGRLRHDSASLETDSRKIGIDNTVDRNSDILKSNDVNDKNTKRRSGRLRPHTTRSDNTSSESDSRLSRIDKNVGRNSDISKKNDSNDKNTKRRSGRLRRNSTSSESDSRPSRIKSTLYRNGDISDKNNSNDKNTKRRSDRLRRDSTSSESDSRPSRIKSTLYRNGDISDKNGSNDKNTKRRSDRLRRDSTSSESDSPSRIKNTLDRNGDISKSNDINDKNTKSSFKNSKNKLKDGKKPSNVGVKNVSVESKDGSSKETIDGNQSKERSRRSTGNYENTPPLRREYSPLEDHAIVQWVSLGSRARKVNGNVIWRELQSQFARIAGRQRSWHSLRNRYLRSILPALGSLALPPSKVAALRAAQAHGEIKSKRRPPLPNPLLTLPPVRSAWAARPRPTRANSTVNEDTRDTAQPSSRASRAHKHTDTPTPQNGRQAQDGRHAAQDGGDSRSPTYSELTRRFATRRGVSTPETEIARQGSASPPPKRTRKLFNPNKKL